jgi:hypothetical protein
VFGFQLAQAQNATNTVHAEDTNNYTYVYFRLTTAYKIGDGSEIHYYISQIQRINQDQVEGNKYYAVINHCMDQAPKWVSQNDMILGVELNCRDDLTKLQSEYTNGYNPDEYKTVNADFSFNGGDTNHYNYRSVTLVPESSSEPNVSPEPIVNRETKQPAPITDGANDPPGTARGVH